MTEDAMPPTVREVIANDAATRMQDEEFDDALWLALRRRVDSADKLAELPDGVRMFFATRMVEWAVGNGGFERAVSATAEYFEEAIAGYRLLRDLAAKQLLQRARALADDPVALRALDAEGERPWHGLPSSKSARIVYVRQHRDEFLL